MIKIKCTLILLALLVSYSSYAQNLLQNSSFENVDLNGKIEKWESINIGSPSLNIYDSILPSLKGERSMGIYLIDINNLKKTNRSFLQSKLKSKLTKGKKYKIVVNYKLSEYSSHSSSSISILFTGQKLDSITIKKYINTPSAISLPSNTGTLYFNNKNIKNKDDLKQWSTTNSNKIEMFYIANGNEEYIQIGNFNANKDTYIYHISNYDTYNTYSYYILDELYMGEAKSVQEYEKINLDLKYTENYIKVWGVFKYFTLYNQKYIDWDSLFLIDIKRLKVGITKDFYNSLIDKYFEYIDSTSNCNKFTLPTNDTLTSNIDYNWININSIINKKNKLKIDRIISIYCEENDIRIISKNKEIGIVEFLNDDKFYSEDVLSVEKKILGVARYWNAINYYYPYKYLIKSKWDTILISTLKKTLMCDSELEYHLTILELTKELNDSHSQTNSKVLLDHFGNLYPAFEISYIEGKSIVSKIYKNEKLKSNGVEIGDEIIEIDNVSTDKLRTLYKKYISGNNPSKINSDIDKILCRGKTNNLKIKISRNKEIKIIYCSRYYANFKQKLISSDIAEPYKIISDSIGYIDIGEITDSQIESAFYYLKDTKGLIIDLRKYPKNTLYKFTEYLYDKEMVFANFLEPNIKYPGLLEFSKPAIAGPKTKNKLYYEKNIILIINENTFSQGEYTALALLQNKNTKTLGSYSAGSNGNITSMKLPGSIYTQFSGLCVLNSNKEFTQSIGVPIDFKITLSLLDILNNSDPLIDKAIRLLK